jgi:hypothetical protein
LSQTPGELLFVERLIFEEVCSVETLYQFGRMRTEFPPDKELRKMRMQHTDWSKFKKDRVVSPQRNNVLDKSRFKVKNMHEDTYETRKHRNLK